MRRIETKQEKEKKEKRNKMIIGIFFIVIMVLSTAGYAFFGNGGSNNGNDNGNTAEDGTFNGRYWVYNLNGQGFYFTNQKDSVADVPVQILSGIGDYTGSKVFVDVGDREDAFTELAVNLQRYAILQKACYGPCEEDLPEKNCNDNLIVLKESGENKVYQDNKCVFIEGSNDMKAVDAFLNKMIFG